MRAVFGLSRPPIRPSVSRRDLVPELGIAAAAVSVTAAIHWALVLRLGQQPLFLFSVTAALLTFWRGLGPGMLASSLGSSLGSSLHALSFHEAGHPGGSVPFLETYLMFAGSTFTCWLIYKLRVDQEDARAVQGRRHDALASVSHELRQPLSSIQLAAAILNKDASEATRERAARLILRSATRLGRLIDELADVTRLEADAIRVERTALCLQDSIRAAADGVRPSIEQRQQYLLIDVGLDPPLWISGDAMRLEQVFGNLLSNASKYSPDGAEISVTARAERGRAVVVVRDTGLGIRREMLEAIFDPFVRDSTAGGDGLGIGLTLVRSLVKEHGGHVAVHSDGPGRGSTFTIELPLVAAPRAAIEEVAL
jgi:signal transduction histidine kinase